MRRWATPICMVLLAGCSTSPPPQATTSTPQATGRISDVTFHREIDLDYSTVTPDSVAAMSYDQLAATRRDLYGLLVRANAAKNVTDAKQIQEAIYRVWHRLLQLEYLREPISEQVPH